MSTEKIIALYIVGTLLLVLIVSFIRSIIKFIRNGFMSDDDIALKKRMEKEIDDLFNECKTRYGSTLEKLKD